MKSGAKKGISGQTGPKAEQKLAISNGIVGSVPVAIHGEGGRG